MSSFANSFDRYALFTRLEWITKSAAIPGSRRRTFLRIFLLSPLLILYKKVAMSCDTATSVLFGIGCDSFYTLSVKIKICPICTGIFSSRHTVFSGSYELSEVQEIILYILVYIVFILVLRV